MIDSIDKLKSGYFILNSLLSDTLLVSKADNLRFRSLSSFPDKELKVRVVAVLDYFSQAALRPLHSYLFRILKRINHDMTFDQTNFKDILFKSTGGTFVSADLSAATDRFPIDLICDVLKGRLPDDFVNAWKDIMVGYPFDYQGSFIYYRTGNPMGAYSS
jgi:hypothetical protein